MATIACVKLVKDGKEMWGNPVQMEAYLADGWKESKSADKPAPKKPAAKKPAAKKKK